MKIAQIAPLIESVPPRLYGGTERIVSYLTEELVLQGHDVTLFASGDSKTSARLVPCCEQALRLDSRVREHVPYHLAMLEKVKRLAARFDVLHFHTDLVHFPVFASAGEASARQASARPATARQAIVTTLHGRQDLFELRDFYRTFSRMPLVSISDAQRTPIADANFVATIPHGVPRDLLSATFRPNGDYLAFVGRIAPEKGVDRAIEIARRVGMPLKIAAKVDRVDETYFRQAIAPLLRASCVQFIGEIDEREKVRFIGDARALLFPIDWPEPFGLVMIEAMACGTPVLAFDRGSVREVIDSGVTGIIVNSLTEAIAAVRAATCLDRRAVRRRFDQRFTAKRMATQYVRLYEQLTAPTRSETIMPFKVPAHQTAQPSAQAPAT
jgi:glycosyltransferase involved in cell wall biosynthesis